MTNAMLAFLAAVLLAAPAGDPEFVTSDPNGGHSFNGYYVHNNLWNAAKYSPCTSTLHARSHDDWSVVTRMNNNAADGAVKTYPNVHKDYRGVPVGSFESLTSRFAETSPRVGIYNVAYDLWINGVAAKGSTEIMVWVDNFNQVPGGRYVQDATFGGRRYKVYKTEGNRYIAFVAAENFTSGTVDLLEMMRWAIARGWMKPESTVNQICFGVEMVSTDDKDATFRVSAFSIDEKMKPGKS
jgi:hypothetical protein